MSTVPQNTFMRHEWDRFEAPINPNTAINQGDMVFRGADNRTLPMSAGTGLAFLGVSEDTNPVASLGDRLDRITIARRGTFRFKTTPGNTYTPYATVYAGADAQTVTVVASGTTKVGYVSPLQPDQSDPYGWGSIVGGAGVVVDVMIEPQFPANTV